MIDYKGTVNLVSQTYRDATGSGVIKADYEFQDNGYILTVKNCLPFAPDLIKAVDSLNRFDSASVIASNGLAYVDVEHRSSRNLQINKVNTPELNLYREMLTDIVHMCAKTYMAMNTFLQLKDDTGFELLRYSEGQRFGEHIDVIQGHPEWGLRKLSAVSYLNDNYTGGELEFARQHITIKPQAQSVVLFPSGFTYPHSSLPIKSGTKYAVVTWFI